MVSVEENDEAVETMLQAAREKLEVPESTAVEAPVNEVHSDSKSADAPEPVEKEINSPSPLKSQSAEVSATPEAQAEVHSPASEAPIVDADEIQDVQQEDKEKSSCADVIVPAESLDAEKERDVDSADAQRFDSTPTFGPDGLEAIVEVPRIRKRDRIRAFFARAFICLAPREHQD